MSNLRSTGHLPLKTSMTNKWKAQAPTSELLERQTRALEESLNKLKIAMHSDKTKLPVDTNVPIWDKGKTGPLSQYANHVLRDEPRRVFDANKPTKIRVLGDEPPATVNRPSLVASLFSNKPTTTTTNTTAKVTKCGQCEKEEAKMKCLECAECYCAGCFAHFHLRGALQRHRCVPLTESRPATPQKKKPTVGADVIFKELRFAQSKDDLLRKSTTAADMYEYIEDDDMESETSEGGQLLNGRYDEKDSAASFQQALLAWRQGGEKKKPVAKKSRSTHEAAVDAGHELNQIAMPNIEFHSSNLSYAEKLLLKKYRRANKNHQAFFEQRTPTREQVQPSSLPGSIDFKDSNIEIQPLYDDLPTVRAEDSARTITAEENYTNGHVNHDDDDDEDEELMRLKQQKRTKSRSSMKPFSRPNSAAMRKKSISRPNSVALFQHPLPSLLATNPSDELKSYTDPHSRPSSAALKKRTKLDYRLPNIWNRNWKPEQSMSDGIDLKSIKIDQNSVAQFDDALNELLDETIIESASRTNNPRSSTTEMPRLEREKPIESAISPRNSPFNFTNSPRKTESSFSVDTGDGGFFTDVKPRQIPSSPKVQRPVIPNLISLRKASIESLSRAPPKRSIALEENRSQLDDHSRPGSSLSSSSLPVSITSSKPDLITRPSIERHPKMIPQTTKKFRVEFSKKSPPPPPPPAAAAAAAAPVVPPMVIEGKKVTSARNSARDSEDRLQQSMNSIRGKISAGVQRSQTIVKGSTMTSLTSITRDGSLTLTDVPVRRSVNNNDREPTKARKAEFTFKDGIKWQNASSESNVRRSSKTHTPRPATPSNPTNSRLAQQFSTYDIDDGRSSRACQDIDDEECFNQLQGELCSELGMTSPGWDASLSEHVLKNLRGTEAQFSEKDLQDNLNLLEIKLRENESRQRSQTDDDLSVHDEIRNL